MRPSVRPVAALLALATCAATAGCGIFGGSDEEPGDIQVYSARHYDLEDAFGAFEEETGLKVDFLFGEDAELLQRLEAEGDGSPADLFITVDAGTCDAAIVNHYYLARELEEKPDMNVELFWASQDGEGVQLNLSGGGVVATSDAKKDAQQLLEWLATDGQDDFVGGNHEFPVNPGVQPDEAAAAFGPFEPMPIDAEAYGRLNAEAVALLEEVGYE